jgi:hypothetical protein
MRTLQDDFGLDARAAVLFGSYARGGADEWSDIDVVVLAGRFDSGITREDVELLWWVAAKTDSRIEPIPCGSTSGWSTTSVRSSRSLAAKGRSSSPTRRDPPSSHRIELY